MNNREMELEHTRLTQDRDHWKQVAIDRGEVMAQQEKVLAIYREADRARALLNGSPAR